MSGRPPKRAKLLSDDDNSSDGGVDLQYENHNESPSRNGLKINAEFAKRFEHNQKRAELHRRTLVLFFKKSATRNEFSF